MRRFFGPVLGGSTPFQRKGGTVWQAVVIPAAVLIAALTRPAAAALPTTENMNLTATAHYSASTEWQSAQNNPNFVASKAFDGELATRWNSDSGDTNGSWLAANWDAPVTINKVVMYERFGRVQGYTIQQLDSSGNWANVYVAAAGDASFNSTIKQGQAGAGTDLTFQVRLDKPIMTKGLRVVFDQVSNVPSIAELEAWNNPTATLTGTVKDTSGNPVSGVTVSAGFDSTVTDASGKYTLVTDATAQGATVNVTASKFGAYRDRIARGLTLSASGPNTHDFALIPLPPNLALTAKADASTEDSGGNNPATNANDGNDKTSWLADSGDTDGSYLDLQWSQPQTFDKITVREVNDRIRNYSLQMYDTTNAKFVDIPGASNINVPAGTAAPILTNGFAAPLTTTRVRLLVNHADNPPQVSEMQVSNAPLGTVSGTVTDVATGKPVPNVTIISDLGAILGTTDAKGAFSILLDADDYVVTASGNGYFAGAPASFSLVGGDKQTIALTAPAMGPDIALTAKASASSEQAGNEATMVNDGDLTTFWLAQDDTNQWVAVTWAKPTTFTVVQLRGYQNAIQISDLQVLGSDGKTWMDLPGTIFAPQFNQPDAFRFPDGVTTTSLRFFMSSTDTAGTPPGLAEMLVFNSPIPKAAP